jgi:hypothetical protein
MPRDHSASENRKMARAKRSAALARTELRQPSVPRISAAGPTSAPIKAEDPETRKLIDDAIAKLGGGGV